MSKIDDYRTLQERVEMWKKELASTTARLTAGIERDHAGIEVSRTDKIRIQLSNMSDTVRNAWPKIRDALFQQMDEDLARAKAAAVLEAKVTLKELES